MAVSAWANVLKVEPCTICGEKVTPQDATVACIYADGRPALACDRHRQDRASWIAAWADFYRQQQSLQDTPHSTVSLYLEDRNIETVAEIKVDVSLHLFTRAMVGRCIIIADKPIEFLSVLRKQWKKITKLLYLERARTLDTWKRLAIQEALDRLEGTTFSASTRSMNAEVIVASPNSVHLFNPPYSTLYICTSLNEKQKVTVLKSLIPGALLVDYDGAFSQLHSLV